VARADRGEIAHRARRQFLIVAVEARQARPRSFIESHTELHARCRVDDGLVDVLNRLDEVGLAQNDIGVGREFEPDRFQFHGY